jgi:hypothetical protein
MNAIIPSQQKHSKESAGRLGGLATLERHGRGHFADIGQAGAAAFWNKYRLAPSGGSDFAIVDRASGRVVSYTSGRRP